MKVHKITIPDWNLLSGSTMGTLQGLFAFSSYCHILISMYSVFISILFCYSIYVVLIFSQMLSRKDCAPFTRNLLLLVKSDERYSHEQ